MEGATLPNRAVIPFEPLQNLPSLDLVSGEGVLEVLVPAVGVGLYVSVLHETLVRELLEARHVVRGVPALEDRVSRLGLLRPLTEEIFPEGLGQLGG